MPGCGTANTIFTSRQAQEKYLAKNNNLYFAFVYLEKAFDQVPRNVVLWDSRKIGIEDQLVKIVQSMCRDAGSRVRANENFINDILAQVGSH